MMKIMHPRYLLFVIIAFVLGSCKKETVNYIPPPTEDRAPVVLLKEIVIPNLPSPYYHFDYNADSNVSAVSFASGLNIYNVLYDGNRITEMRNTIVVNKDRLQYTYDNNNRVAAIRFADSAGVVYSRVFFVYNAQQLTDIEWELKSGPGFVVYKTMNMTYHPDGNLKDLRYHRPGMTGQPAITYTDRYENYDTGINADGFSLVHNEFFEHLLLLPGVHLQKNNPAKQTRTGDGVNFIADYTYTYNNKKQPLVKSGNVLFVNGADAGKNFETRSVFSYYE
jgi:hypothetical protein